MDKGTYTGRRADFGRYATAVFNPFLFTGNAGATGVVALRRWHC